MIVLFVGGLDSEKRCDRLLRVIEQLRCEERIQFWFAGSGQLSKRIEEFAAKSRNVKYFGYVKNQELMAKLYTSADVVWAQAEETYLGRPAIEALVCGTPIITPNVPGVMRKVSKGIRLSKDVIPKDIGWMVDDEDIHSVNQLLCKLATTKETDLMRPSCKQYGRMKYSSKNADELVKMLLNAI